MTLPNWDERYGADGFFYGTEPNAFLAAEAGRLSAGARVLSLGEGEGRNAVFLAGRGLQVTGVDGSAVGGAKAQRLAAERGVAIAYTVGDLASAPFPEALDAVVNVFCHLPSALRRSVHRRALACVRPGGLFLLELYRPEQIALGTGGPRDPDSCATLAGLREDFAGCEELLGRSIERPVIEGRGHTGHAAVVQAIFVKA